MEPEGSLPHSQASATCPYPGPAQSSPYTHIPPKIYNTCTILVEASDDEETFGTNGRRWKDKTKRSLNESVWVGEEWKELAK